MPAWRRVQKKRYVSAISDVSFLSSFWPLDHFDHHVVVRNASLEFYRKKTTTKKNNNNKQTNKQIKKPIHLGGFNRGTLTSVSQFLTSVISFYSFPNDLKPRIAKIQICETVKITKTISSFSDEISFVIFTVYLIGKSLFHRKAHRKLYF